MLKKFLLATSLLSSTLASAMPSTLEFNGAFGGNLFYEDILVKRLGLSEELSFGRNGGVISKINLDEITIICIETDVLSRPQDGSNFDCQVILKDGNTTIFGTSDDNQSEANFLTIYMKDFYQDTITDHNNGVKLNLYRFHGSLSCSQNSYFTLKSAFKCKGISKN